MGVSYRRDGQTIHIAVSRRALALAVGFLHGPLDIGLTLAAWHLETNALVELLGPGAWVGLKIVAIAALPVALSGVDSEPWLPGDRYVQAYADELAVALLVVSILLAVALIVPNLIVLAALG